MITKKNIAIFLSGSGSNARKIIEHFKNHPSVKVALLVSNKPDLGANLISEEHQIPLLSITKPMLYDETIFLKSLKDYEIDFIVLAGFLLLVPQYLVKQFDHKVVNIHPALLPKFGGKGMYGHHVHEAVKASGEIESGMTIHFCNAQYDEGDIIFQAKTVIEPSDSPTDIARKVLVLEHTHYARVIESVLAIGH
ncbi:MAG: phosphoribosylglycinamide formyltransferase [Saprospiraceae bacterium]|nr:phosphoribosylglycinamide formyltransferase [Saprospiraceae bacterium]